MSLLERCQFSKDNRYLKDSPPGMSRPRVRAVKLGGLRICGIAISVPASLDQALLRLSSSCHSRSLGSRELDAALRQPRLNGVGAICGFPLFEHLMITSFCFDDFTSVGILVNLHLPRFASFCVGSCWSIWNTNGVLAA